MTDEVYRAIAAATSGYVEAPAGCGKTDAIIRSVGNYCDAPQLILTHTNAGVDVLRQRFKIHQIPKTKYHVDTIAGWAWGWVRKYPVNAVYEGESSITNWGEVYGGILRLLEKDFVRQVILNSYGGVIVDEYQDCTLSMHSLIIKLSEILPCRILGDPLQGIFDFNDPLIAWTDVESAFTTNLGVLDTPHRWIRAENEQLGRWLLGTRTAFQQNQEPNYRGAPIERRNVSYANLSAQLIALHHQKQGRICIIGPKARSLPISVETTLVNNNYKVLEPNELSALRGLVQGLVDGNDTQKAAAAIKFLKNAYGGIETSDKTFIEKLLKAENQSPRRADRISLITSHPLGATPALLRDLLAYIEGMQSAVCKHLESVSALKCILDKHTETGLCLKALYADEIAKRKAENRSNVFRCIGSTLLVKGLEFDHAVILRDRNWGSMKDLYVALTRGSKSVTLMELAS